MFRKALAAVALDTGLVADRMAADLEQGRIVGCKAAVGLPGSRSVLGRLLFLLVDPTG